MANLTNTMGAFLIGVVIAAMLYGVTVLQAFYYYTHQRDPWSLKILVGLVLLFETVHQALITHTVFFYVILNYGEPDVLERLVWSLLLEIVFNGLTALLVQSFLTMRIWRLGSRHKVWLTGICATLFLAEFASIIAFTTLSLQLQTFEQLTHLKGLSITVNVLAVASDVLIATSLCTILYKSRTGFQRSDTMIRKLILYTVNTGAVTSLCAVASLIGILVAPGTFYYIMFFFSIGRLYSNSLLATLNARKRIRAAGEALENTSSGLSFSLHPYPRTGTDRFGMNTKQRPADISIKVDTTQEFTTDLSGEHEQGDTSRPGTGGLEEKRGNFGMVPAAGGHEEEEAQEEEGSQSQSHDHS